MRAAGATRLDQLLVERGLFDSREKARRAVMAGLVEVGGRRQDKPGTAVKPESELKVLGPAEPFAFAISRAVCSSSIARWALEPPRSVGSRWIDPCRGGRSVGAPSRVFDPRPCRRSSARGSPC